MPIKACVFDAYGTLFDVAAAAREAAEEPGRESFAAHWPQIAADWRTKQLQYSWLRAVTGEYCSFWQVTQDGLDWAMERAGLDDPELRERLLALYFELSAYPEVPQMLADLAKAGFKSAILSNGSPDMLEGAVDSAMIGDWLSDVISVEDVGIFKPAAAVYQLVPDKMGVDVEEVLFVSSNGWDAACAKGFGFRTAWVNRAGDPLDRLPAAPDEILADLTPIPELAKRF